MDLQSGFLLPDKGLSECGVPAERRRSGVFLLGNASLDELQPGADGV